MKKNLITLLATTAAIVMQANTPNFDMVGFATLEGGTTGGEGGETVYPTNFEELKRYAEDETTPYIIVIDREINTGITAYVDTTSGHISTEGAVNTITSTYGEIIKLGSNKTLIGEDDKGFLNRIGINIQCKENIIIRNLRISLQDVPVDKSGENKIVAFRNGAEVLVGDPDCISMQADDEDLPANQRITQHIWIDHANYITSPKRPNTKTGMTDLSMPRTTHDMSPYHGATFTTIARPAYREKATATTSIVLAHGTTTILKISRVHACLCSVSAATTISTTT